MFHLKAVAPDLEWYYPVIGPVGVDRDLHVGLGEARKSEMDGVGW